MKPIACALIAVPCCLLVVSCQSRTTAAQAAPGLRSERQYAEQSEARAWDL